jgi:rhamnose utilization protein RhaD (predicted bifunctional aldolase and dehydrogenase)
MERTLPLFQWPNQAQTVPIRVVVSFLAQSRSGNCGSEAGHLRSCVAGAQDCQRMQAFSANLRFLPREAAGDSGMIDSGDECCYSCAPNRFEQARMLKERIAMELLKNITELSHEFGTPKYLKGGGGNTSAKNKDTLWIKPSGTSLLDMKPELFVAMDRAKLTVLYRTTPPAGVAAREEWVKNTMVAAVRPGAIGRPSVEAPLHNLLDAAYVVHTHPALVNGLTSGKNGPKICMEFFPDSLWVDYVDPGYTLCMRVVERIDGYRKEKGREPQMVFLGNHGVFVGGDLPGNVREAYTLIMGKVAAVYRKAGVAMELKIGPAPSRAESEAVHRKVADVLGGEHTAAVSASGMFAYAKGAVSPDQIVYMRSYPMTGDLTPAALKDFQKKYGYSPRIVVTKAGVFGLGSSQKNADLALELAQDSALVVQLAEAFGGIRYMTDDEGNFIDKWEAEAYRRKMVK